MMAPDVIIVGSGPAGVSAAWPLVEAGLTVAMLDAGDGCAHTPSAERPGLAAMRRLGEPRWLLGSKLEHLRSVGAASPKLRTATDGGVDDGGYLAANHIEPTGFRVIGALVRGGLSTVWGAIVCELADDDLADWPVEIRRELRRSYVRVAERIGVSGEAADAIRLGIGGGVPLQPPLPLSPGAAHLLQRARLTPAEDLALGRPVSAVLTEPRPGRSVCSLDRACMWGCAKRAVYSAADELPHLAAYSNFSFHGGVVVEAIERDGADWLLVGRRGGSGDVMKFRAPRLILAAGTLASTRLALTASGDAGRWRPLAHTPAMAFALLQPSRLGRPQGEGGYGNAQLCFKARTEQVAAFGLLYDAAVMASPDIIARMPLTRPGAIAVVRALLPALLLGLLYFPGAFSNCRVRLAADGRLEVEGGVTPNFAVAAGAVTAVMRRRFRGYGAWLLPGSLQLMEPGAEIHVGACLPMGRETSSMGELPRCPGLHLVDSAVLPMMTAKHHTLTVMANADRIGRGLAASATR